MADTGNYSIRSHKGRAVAVRLRSGYRLCAEEVWLIEGSDTVVRAVEVALEPFAERVGSALLLRFGNAVGTFDGGPLGYLDVHSGKWDEADFDRMLAAIARRMAILPFSAGSRAGRGHERSVDADSSILYHEFVYVRHILSDKAPPQDRLLPALHLVLACPHRRFERVATWSPLGAVRRVEPRALLGMVAPQAMLTRVPAGLATDLAKDLRGHLPRRVEETRVQTSVDVPENQFVKSFLGRVLGLVEQIRGLKEIRGGGHFARRIRADCDAIERKLAPIRHHAIWDEVSELRRISTESQVLQRRRGYREIFQHFVRMRLTARLPLRPDATRNLLEIKDIAVLYEMWCFLEVARQLEGALGDRPVQADEFQVGDLDARLGRGMRLAWRSGVELFYNLRYSRSLRNRSYSVALRPDIVLRIPSGPSAGDHLFDAKFKLRHIVDAVTDDVVEDGDSHAGVKQASFKNADLYKMHAYRDAIEHAMTVWILYPGTEICFFDEYSGAFGSVESVRAGATGVGALPLLPGTTDDAISRAWIQS